MYKEIIQTRGYIKIHKYVENGAALDDYYHHYIHMLKI